ncbi:hypothetical protein [Streptomyces sp. NPDC101776]|uniref:preprotein translocase subunit SecA n=1 Tax=Streptomyces sp. NPDC101776 TaxID=3366146 RepID=UPI00381FE36D
MDPRVTVEALKRRAEEGESPESLSHSALDLVARSAAGASVPFDDDIRRMAVRLAGGTMIHGGRVAGEDRLRGARLLAGLLHAQAGRGVHLITPDEPQAAEEGERAAALYDPLGVTVGVLRDMDRAERRAAYGADVTVGAYPRFGLDLLHDRQIMAPEDCGRRDAPAAVVKDPGHVLVASVAEPLTLVEDDVSPAHELREVARLTAVLSDDQDYAVDADRGVVQLTRKGRIRLHDAFGVTDPAGMETLLLEKRVGEAVLANHRYARGRDYDVAGAEVVPASSGELPKGVRLRGGLLQAIEVKEGLAVSDAQWVTTTVSVFEYFRRYSHVGGTSLAELMFTAELEELFGLTVWDLRGPDELSSQRQYAQQMAVHLDLNRRIARWSRLGEQQRAELDGLRDRSREPHELRTLLRRSVAEAVREELRHSAGDPRRLRRGLGELATGLPPERLTGTGDPQRIAETVLTNARSVCDDHLLADPDTQRAGVRSAVDQAAVYQAQAEMYYRDRHWPDDLAAFEEALMGLHEELRTQFGRAVARHALRRNINS